MSPEKNHTYDVEVTVTRIYRKRVTAPTAGDACVMVGDLVRAGQVEDLVRAGQVEELTRLDQDFSGIESVCAIRVAPE